MKFFDNLLNPLVKVSLRHSIFINNQVLSRGRCIHHGRGTSQGGIRSGARGGYSPFPLKLQLLGHPTKNAFLVIFRNALTLTELFVDKGADSGFDVRFWL